MSMQSLQRLLTFAIILIGALLLAAVNAKEVHQHSMQVVPTNKIPKIELLITRDPMDGINVHLNLDNYTLNAPSADNTNLEYAKDDILQGHAHVFINGNKYLRTYATDFHIPASALKQGVNQIAVSLNSHKHQNWVYQEQFIVSSVFLNLDEPQLVLHNYSSQPLSKQQAHHH